MALQGKWVLSENTTANRADSSGNGNNLTASASIAQSTGHGGGANLANNFTGTQYLAITDAAQTGLDFTGAFSISAWIYRAATGANHTIAGKWATDDLSYLLIASSANKLVGYISADGVSLSVTVTGATTLSATTWYHVMMVYDGATVKLYVDNVQDASANYTGSVLNGTADFRIGSNGNAANKFNGRIDDVAVFNHALDAGERSTWYGYGDDFSGGAGECRRPSGNAQHWRRGNLLQRSYSRSAGGS